MSSSWCASASVAGLLVSALTSCAASLGSQAELVTEKETVMQIEIAPDLDQRLARFAPVVIETDLSELSAVDRQVLDELIAASKLMGEIFLRQAWRQNPALLERLQELDHPQREQAITYFKMMVGPWDRLDEINFLGDAARPEGAGFYPADLESSELAAWVARYPASKETLEGLFWVVRRTADGGFRAVPYSTVYREWLEPAAAHLRRAADLTDNQSLATFLRSRADAFTSDDYYQSDMDWMDLDSTIEATIGPYEVYEDRLLGAKAAYESFITVVSPELSEQLSKFKAELPFMESNLPIPDGIKNKDRGTESPIRVADLVFSGGDTRAGVQTIAFNLPNDERVREAKGSKKVLLRNVMVAKFDKIMLPVARQILDPSHHGDLSSEAFFDETFFHELSHGLGPGRIVVDGRQTEVRKELAEIYSTSEECKADVMGAYNVLAMIDKGHFPAEFRRPFLVTYFAGLFRSARFGVAEAHGRGAAAQINYFVEQGGAVLDPQTRRYRVDTQRLEQLIGDLTAELCELQAAGDKVATTVLFDRYGVLTPELESVLAGLEGIPVDIRPIYAAAGE